MDELAIPEIDLTRCTHCGNCVTGCPVSAVEWQEGNPVIARRELCTYCGLCEEICPAHAIALSYIIVFAEPSAEKPSPII